ncbi:MAG TPA: hypothetical protein VD970_12105 [Acetobacteraceae bacterium]|nr:hypothetical protein [Acetobacteraceae bacterium]
MIGRDPNRPPASREASPQEPPLRHDPVAAFLTAAAAISAMLLALRYLAEPGLAQAVARDIALMAGPLGCTVMIAVLAATLAVPLLPPDQPSTGRLIEMALPIYDEGVTLTIVLSGVASVAALVVNGHPSVPHLWFALQALAAWGCHRLRKRAMPA